MNRFFVDDRKTAARRLRIYRRMIRAGAPICVGVCIAGGTVFVSRVRDTEARGVFSIPRAPLCAFARTLKTPFPQIVIQSTQKFKLRWR